MIATLLLGLVLTPAIWASEIVHLSAILDEDEGFRLHKGLLTGENVIGTANFENSMYEKGWSSFEVISTENNVDDNTRVRKFC